MPFMDDAERDELTAVRADLLRLRRDVRAGTKTATEASVSAAERGIAAAFEQSPERYGAEVAWLNTTYGLTGDAAYTAVSRAKFFGGNISALRPREYVLSLSLNHQIPEGAELRDLVDERTHLGACRDYFIKDYYYPKFFNPRGRALLACAKELDEPLPEDRPSAARELVARRPSLSHIDRQLFELRLAKKPDAVHRNANEARTLYVERSPYVSKSYADKVPIDAEAFCQSLNVELLRFLLTVLPPAIVLAAGAGAATLLEQLRGVQGVSEWIAHDMYAKRPKKTCVVRVRKYELGYRELGDEDAKDASRGVLTVVHTDFWGFRPGTGPNSERESAAAGKIMARVMRGKDFDDVVA